MSPMKFVQFLAIVLTALALVPVGAHVFELFTKMNLEQDQYMAVQQVYRGGELFGFVIVGALAANLQLAVLSRDQRRPLLWGAAAFVLVAATRVTFVVRTFPTNQATDNWSTVPRNWRDL